MAGKKGKMERVEGKRQWGPTTQGDGENFGFCSE